MQKWEYLKLVVSIGTQTDVGHPEACVQEVHFKQESIENQHGVDESFLEPFGNLITGFGHYEGRPDPIETDWETYRDTRRGISATVISTIHKYGLDGWELFQIHKETFERDAYMPPYEHTSLDEPIIDKGLRFIETTEYWFKRPIRD